MDALNIVSWNINGIRSAFKKGFLEWLKTEVPDILCLQETKAHPEQIEKQRSQLDNYHTFWNYPETKGYSGVATFTRKEPAFVRKGFAAPQFDSEGRVLITEFPEFILYNVYFPNGKMGPERLQYKLDFYDAFLEHIDLLKNQGRRLIICGDYNTAHKEIDIARPKQNEKLSGFLPIEREWMDKLIDHGYIDTFRHFNNEPHQYTWWDAKTNSRARNVGWRIDYFFVTENVLPSISSAFIMPDVMGSDHCPIGITLALS